MSLVQSANISLGPALYDLNVSLHDLDKAREHWQDLYTSFDTLAGEAFRALRGYRTIRVLDFDILYPLIWKAQLQGLERMENLGLLGFEQSGGLPMTSSFVFNNTRRHFTIPPGAAFEMARHLANLEQRVIKKESKLRQEVVEVLTANPGESASHKLHKQIALRLGLDLPRQIDQEIDKLVDMGIRLRELRRVLEHDSYIRWDTLSKELSAEADTKEILRVLGIFNAHRSGKSISNYLDALNIAYCDALMRAKPRPNDTQGIYPLIASSTNMILRGTFIEADDETSPITSDAVRPVSTVFLILATALEIFAEDDGSRETTLRLGNLADTYSKQLSELLFASKRFLRDAAREVQNPTDFHNVPLSHFAHLDTLFELASQYTRYQNSIQSTIGDTVLQVMSGDIQLSENYEIERKYVLERLLDSPKGDQFREPIMIRDAQWLSSVTTTNRYLTVEGGITDTESGFIRIVQKVFPVPRLTLQVTIMIPYFDQTLFVLEKTAQSQSSLCYWNYGCNIGETLEHVSRLLSEANNMHTRNTDVIVTEIFSDTDFFKIELQTGDSVDNWLKSIFSIATEPKYIRFNGVHCTVFLDLLPATKTSKLLELAILSKSEKLYGLIAELYEKTSIFPIAISSISNLLNRQNHTLEEAIQEYTVEKHRGTIKHESVRMV